MIELLTLFISAIGVGFVSAIAGIGGGSLLVPFMVLVLGYDIKIAVAASLLCVIATSSMAASEYLERGIVDLKTALLLEPITSLGAIVGANLTLTLPSNIVEGLLGILLLYVSLTMLKKSLRKTSIESPIADSTEIDNRRKIAGTLISFIAGLSSGMLGIGGGVLKVPIMTLVMGLPIKTAVATSSFMIGLTASSGGIIYLVGGMVRAEVAASLIAGIIPGAYLGARYMRRLEPRTIRLVFSLILLYASIRLMYSLITS